MNYAIVKMNYERGLWSAQMVRMALDKRVITEDQYREIVDGDEQEAATE